MTKDRPVLGMMLMLGFCIMAPMGDSIAKLLGSTIPLFQLLWVRFALQALFLLPVVVLTRRPWRTSRRITWSIALRTVLHIIGVGAMFQALRFLPVDFCSGSTGTMRSLGESESVTADPSASAAAFISLSLSSSS